MDGNPEISGRKEGQDQENNQVSNQWKTKMAEGRDEVPRQKQNSSDYTTIRSGSDSYEGTDLQVKSKRQAVSKENNIDENTCEESENKHSDKKTKSFSGLLGSLWKKFNGKESKKTLAANSEEYTPKHNQRFANKAAHDISDGKSKIFKRPMRLIATDTDGKFEIEKETLELLRAVDNDLVVVAIAGLYRTGKSYLLNCLAECSEGFELGNTIESKTKGIWVWCRTHPRRKDLVLVLIDTEGLGDADKGDAGHDNNIFTLAALLCNVLVYNMMTAFNQDAVEKLTFVTEISKNIKFTNTSDKNQHDGDKLSLILPTFVLCVRDFYLKLERKKKVITEDQYLESCLELKEEKNKTQNQKYNRPRESIRKYFPKRKCFTFTCPGEINVIQRLETAEPHELAALFLEKTDHFIDYIFNCDAKRLLSSKPVDGAMFASLVEIYVAAIQNGKVPDVDDAIMVVSKAENKKFAADAVAKFADSVKEISLPVMESERFQKLFEKIQKASIEEFRHGAMYNSVRFEEKACKEMEKIWKELAEKNKELVLTKLSDELQETYDRSVGQRFSDGDYSIPGGFALYKRDMNKLNDMYKDKTKNTYEASDVLHKFLAKEADQETRIMDADEKLSNEDRKREISEMKKTTEEMMEKNKKLLDETMEKERERSKKHAEDIEKDRKKHMEQEQAKMALVVDTWKCKYESSEEQIQLMKDKNEKCEEKIIQLGKRMASKEKENEARLQNLYEKEQEKYNQGNKELVQKIKDMAKKQKERDAAYEREMQRMRAELKDKCSIS